MLRTITERRGELSFLSWGKSIQSHQSCCYCHCCFTDASLHFPTLLFPHLRSLDYQKQQLTTSASPTSFLGVSHTFLFSSRFERAICQRKSPLLSSKCLLNLSSAITPRKKPEKRLPGCQCPTYRSVSSQHFPMFLHLLVSTYLASLKEVVFSFSVYTPLRFLSVAKTPWSYHHTNNNR